MLVDSSAWVEFLRDSGSPACQRVKQVLMLDEEIATCHPIRMEVLAGARDERHLGQLRGLLARANLVTTMAQDFEEAAALYRQCRRSGGTIRKMIDCLIVAHAIRNGIPVLHADADFDVLAQHTQLRVASF
jgi:predicted nucleic acid-binding protein